MKSRAQPINFETPNKRQKLHYAGAQSGQGTSSSEDSMSSISSSSFAMTVRQEIQRAGETFCKEDGTQEAKL